MTLHLFLAHDNEEDEVSVKVHSQHLDNQTWSNVVIFRPPELPHLVAILS